MAAFTVGANTNVTFGPGIYYVRGGNLAFTAGSKVTANGATFVLEGTASYQMNGGSQPLNLSAPTSNCVQPANYPLAAYTLPSSNPPATPNSYAPYDGTGGQGICGVLIYQQRGDTTADNIVEGANSTITGTIYARDAALNVSGGASISSSVVNGVSQGLAFIQNTLSLTGSGTINVSATPGSGSSTPTTNASQSYLIN